MLKYAMPKMPCQLHAMCQLLVSTAVNGRHSGAAMINDSVV